MTMTEGWRRNAAPQHAHEQDRLESLHSYGLLDTPPAPAYDGLAQLASSVCGTPIAMVSLVDADRQWFKAKVGVDFRETPRDEAFCAHVAATGRPLVVSDARRDARFAGFDLVRRGVRSYAGVPLIGRDGLPLGALCVLDRRRRRFSNRVLALLRVLGDQVTSQMELDRIDLRGGAARRLSRSPLEEGEVLRRALDERQLLLHYQPIVDLTTRQPSGVEALLRWHPPGRGLVGPGEFLPAIEGSGLIAPVGRFVADTALRALAAMRDQGSVSPTFGVAINVAPAQLYSPGLSRSILDGIARHHLPPELVTVELTEAGAGPPLAVVRTELEQLRSAGVRIDADDFGTGHSTLERLLDLPLTGIKLDMAIVQRAEQDPRAAAVVRGIIDTAHQLDLNVVGEGVETEAQLDMLVASGCDRAQGYLFGRPAPLDAMLPRAA